MLIISITYHMLRVTNGHFPLENDGRTFPRGSAHFSQGFGSSGLGLLAAAKRLCKVTSWSSVVATSHKRACSAICRLWSFNGPIAVAAFQTTGPVRLLLPDGA